VTGDPGGRRLRVGVDVSLFEVAKTGVRTYVDEMLVALPAAGADVLPLRPPPHANPVGPVAKAARHARHQYWLQIGLPRALERERCDVLLAPEYEAPLGSRCPHVVVFHDASIWLNPEQYNPLWRALIDGLAVPAARRAARVVTVSESAKQDLVRLLHFAPGHVVVVPEAPRRPASPSPEETASTLRRLGLRPDGYFLHVGVIERRKNLVRLVEAFALLAGDLPLRLVLAGQPGPKRPIDDSSNVRAAIDRLGLADRVVLTGFVSEEDLATLYRNALATVLPSLLEGFGLPVLEAYQYGSPLICSDRAALPEVAGDAALYVDPEDVGALAARMREVAADEGLRRRLVEAGGVRVQGFSWHLAAVRTLKVLQEAVGC